MRGIGSGCVLRGGAVICILAGLAAAMSAQAQAQGEAAPGSSNGQTVKALLVSDIHFEPFWDPGKVEQLAKAPESEWNAILTEPEAADRQARFAQLQQSCHSKGVDTSYALYQSSLRAIKENAGGAKFVLVSGDLIAHDFDCKFRTVLPKASAGSVSGVCAEDDPLRDGGTARGAEGRAGVCGPGK